MIFGWGWAAGRRSCGPMKNIPDSLSSFVRFIQLKSVPERTQEEYLRWVRRLAAHTGVACASLATQEEVLTFLHWLIKKFLRRWSLHVLPKGLMRVRHYGFLSAAGKKRRERVASILGVQPPELPPVATDPDQAGSGEQDGSGTVPPNATRI